MTMNVLRAWIESRFDGYRHRFNVVDGNLPHRLEKKAEKHVAVIGAGLAGLTAACTLAERGFRVSLYDKYDYLGGKVGAWPVDLPGGEQTFVEHGFHAFFRHYHNLIGFLGKLGATRSLIPISDYRILTLNGPEYSFADIETTPVLNLLSMLHKKVYTLGDILANPRTMQLAHLLAYHPQKTFDRFDHVSFERFADDLRLPKSLRLMFNSFSRAFFSSPSDMSAAELIKSFHFFFLSHDGGLIYDYPDDSYELSLLAPMQELLERHEAKIHLGKAIGAIGVQGDRYRVAGKIFDYVVLAADVVGSRRIADNSPDLQARFPVLSRKLGGLRNTQRYSVLRLWVDKRCERDLPGFVITDLSELLDSVSFYERLEKSSAAWADQHGGSVLELHSYAVPDHLADEAAVRKQFLDEFTAYFPEMRGMRILGEHMQLKSDFTALHKGLYHSRPSVETEAPGLVLAGDWVKLPFPAMLMEAACSAGLLAANRFLQAEELQEEQVYSVPPTGILARD